MPSGREFDAEIFELEQVSKRIKAVRETCETAELDLAQESVQRVLQIMRNRNDSGRKQDGDNVSQPAVALGGKYVINRETAARVMREKMILAAKNYCAGLANIGGSHEDRNFLIGLLARAERATASLREPEPVLIKARPIAELVEGDQHGE